MLLPGLVKVIPVSLKIAAACGIGLFLALIGLSNTTGIGAVSGARTTSLTIAGCPEEFLVDGMCASHKMTSPTVCSYHDITVSTHAD
jgi:AGZA family xanthine/uracil permease-like MFS transporter